MSFALVSQRYVKVGIHGLSRPARKEPQLASDEWIILLSLRLSLESNYDGTCLGCEDNSQPWIIDNPGAGLSDRKEPEHLKIR